MMHWRTMHDMGKSAALGLASALALAATAFAQTPAAADGANPHAATTDYWVLVFVLLLATFIGLGVIRSVSRLLAHAADVADQRHLGHRRGRVDRGRRARITPCRSACSERSPCSPR